MSFLHIYSSALMAHFQRELARIKPTERNNFEIDKVGSFLHWTKQDIHIDLDDLGYTTDDKWRKKADCENLIHKKNFGKALTTLRKKHGLKQTEIAGLSDRQVKRIENGETRPTVNSLTLLAKAHKMNLGNYLEALGQQVLSC